MTHGRSRSGSVALMVVDSRPLGTVFVPPPFVVGDDFGNDGEMRSLRRRAAVGATTAALLFAGAGTTVAAVRAARYEGGVISASLDAPRPPDARTDRRSRPSEAEIPLGPGGTAAVPPDLADATSGRRPAGPQASVGPGNGLGGTPAPTTGGVVIVGGQPVDSAVQRAPRTAPETTVGPASGATPTSRPDPSSAAACPSDSGAGALPHRTGQLEAVNFSLPWPGLGAVVLLPQVSARRPAGSPVRLAGSTAGAMAGDGSSLVLSNNPVAATYTIAAGSEQSSALIRFTQPVLTDRIEHQACRDRSLVLYDVRRATMRGSPLRIVGVVAPSGTVTIAPDGGTARFHSEAAGVFSVTLLTATDAGMPGPLVTVTVDVS